MDLNALKAANAKRWADAKVTRNFVSVAKSLVAAKQRYLKVEKYTGVPWYIVAVIHEREASQRWDTQLGQGDPLNKVSVHIPAGRGPFENWETGAIDALVKCPPYAARNKDWSAGGSLTLLETYNGIGYYSHGIPSPYLWSGTDQVKKPSGKYIRDGVFDPSADDQQLGCAGIIKSMMALDPTITFTGVVLTPVPTAPKPIAVPPAEPKPVNGWLVLLSKFLSLFRR